MAIPKELIALNQWVTWRYKKRGNRSKLAKILYHPSMGVQASVDNPATWTTHKEASAYLHDYDGLGFVLTDNDPYCFIDLDAPSNQKSLDDQMAIVESLDSYSEISPSGRGLHVICKAVIPSGRRRGDIEVYTTGRYMTMTGDVYRDKRIKYRQDVVSSIWSQLASEKDKKIENNGEVIDEFEKYSDEQIVKVASESENGHIFADLWMGKWDNKYHSQSEADFALIDILGFYSRNRRQITRLFLSSGLGRRGKSKRIQYVSKMVEKSFDNYVPTIDLDELINKLNLSMAETNKAKVQIVNEPESIFVPKTVVEIGKSKEPQNFEDTTFALPTGLMGDMARFFYASSPLPVPEMSIAAAISLMAGVCGKAYNVSGAGLNQYVLLLANTGVGKEAMALGIGKLVESVKMQVPNVEDFLGPAEISSGQALLVHLAQHSKCFLSICGEFGLKLQQISSPRASTYESNLMRVLLHLYSKSGRDAVLSGGIYADRTKNIEPCRAPAVSLLGESVPSEFYNTIDERTITGGLLPRFTIIEYNGPRVSLNEGHEKVLPSVQLQEDFAKLAANCLLLMRNNNYVDIEYPKKHFTELSEFCKDQVNSTTFGVVRQLWSRAHLKILKLAGLRAVGNSLNFPKISVEDATWAQGIVKQDILKVSERFFSGEIGQTKEGNEMAQVKKVEDMLVTYLITKHDKLKKYDVPERIHKDHVVTYGFLSRKLVGHGLFKKDKIGSTNAIRRALQMMADNGDIVELSKLDLLKRYDYKGRAFMVKNVGILNRIRTKALRDQ